MASYALLADRRCRGRIRPGQQGVLACGLAIILSCGAERPINSSADDQKLRRPLFIPGVAGLPSLQPAGFPSGVAKEGISTVEALARSGVLRDYGLVRKAIRQDAEVTKVPPVSRNPARGATCLLDKEEYSVHQARGTYLCRCLARLIAGW